MITLIRLISINRSQNFNLEKLHKTHKEIQIIQKKITRNMMNKKFPFQVKNKKMK